MQAFQQPKEFEMSVWSDLSTRRGLTWVLRADAASGLGLAALQLAWPEVLSSWLGLPVSLLQGSAGLVLGFVALAAWLALQPDPPRPALGLLVLGNLAWVVASGVLMATSPTLTFWGLAYVGGQALAVLALVSLQARAWWGPLPEAAW